MPTTQLQLSLDQYANVWPKGLVRFPAFDSKEEQARVESIRSFIALHPNALERDCIPGHITGSALVVNPSLDRVLLTLHAKLGKWLQLGGHADGESDIAASALREAREESGRTEVEFYPWEEVLGLSREGASPVAIDCDIHEIPARGENPSHLHYDLRFLCVLDDTLPLQITSESKDLRWLTLDQALAVTSELSMLRQFEKLAAIKRLIHKSRVG
jgi:8-oxo-dGTP pyrophosphatase MutT (NUDIX family)